MEDEGGGRIDSENGDEGVVARPGVLHASCGQQHGPALTQHLQDRGEDGSQQAGEGEDQAANDVDKEHGDGEGEGERRVGEG